MCQAYGGPTYEGSYLWDWTSDGLWVADHYVQTGTTGFVQGLPRCDLDPVVNNGTMRRSFHTRALVALATAAVTSGALLIAAAAASAAAPLDGRNTSSALSAVNMELAVKAAQWDPVKADSGVTAGAGPSVEFVESALRDRGLLEATYVDGHFGTRTVAAYSQWQKSLGYAGIDATGLPGRTR